MQHVPLSDTLTKFHTDKPIQKTDKAYGAILAQKVLTSLADNSGYFALRNLKFKDNRDFAEGRHSMKQFLDMLNIDGKTSYITLDWEAPKIAPKFMEVILGRFMEYEEAATVKAVDAGSLKEKVKRKREAEFRMHMQAQLAELQQVSGVPLVGPDDYIPEDKDDLELYYELEDRLFEEVAMESIIQETLLDNGVNNFKRQVLVDAKQTGMMAAKVYRDINGVKRFRRCLPENMVYAYSTMDDFSDCPLIGELVKLRVSEFREQYPNVPEQRIFEMVCKSSQDPRTTYMQFNQNWITSAVRPYDDALIEVFEFAVITTEDKMWVEGRDRFNKAVIDDKKNAAVYTNKDGNASKQAIGAKKQLINKRIKVVYNGVYCMPTKEMLLWELQANMIKPHYALHEVLLPWVIIMPSNREMNNIALAERIKSDIRGMTLARLKLQQLLAKLKPDGIAVDIRGLNEIDLLGSGNNMTPMELQQVSDQTGVHYFVGQDEDGNGKGIPISSIENNSAVSKIQTVINAYNFYLQSLRDMIGVNELAEGQAPNPKMGKGVMNNSIAISNRATHFIYEAYIKLLDNVAKRLVVLEWYDIIEGRRELTHGLRADQVSETQFDVNISMLPTADDLQYVQIQTEKAMTAGLINFEEAFKVNQYAKTSIKVAMRWLSRYQRKREEQMQQSKQMDYQNNAQLQAQTAKANAQTKVMVESTIANGKVAVQKEANKGKQDEFIQQLILASMQSGGQIPPMFQKAVQLYMQNLTDTLALTSGEKQLEGIEQQQQFAQMQQQMQGGEEPMEGQEQGEAPEQEEPGEQGQDAD